MRAIVVVPLIVLLAYFVFVNHRVETLPGSGVIEEVSREVGSFDQIEICGATRVFLQQGDTYSVRVEGEDNMLKHLSTDVKAGILKVKLRNPSEYLRLQPTESIRVYVTAPKLDRVCVKGAADITSEGVWKSDNLRLQMHGAGEMELVVDVKSLAVSSQGAGHIRVEGRATELNLVIAGVTDFEGEKLKCSDCSVAVTGNGHATLNARSNLKVRVTGTGEVLYHGNPRVDSEVTGFGRVEQLG